MIFLNREIKTPQKIRLLGYRKPPTISPRLLQVHKLFQVDLYTGNGRLIHGVENNSISKKCILRKNKSKSVTFTVWMGAYTWKTLAIKKWWANTPGAYIRGAYSRRFTVLRQKTQYNIAQLHPRCFFSQRSTGNEIGHYNVIQHYNVFHTGTNISAKILKESSAKKIPKKCF